MSTYNQQSNEYNSGQFNDLSVTRFILDADTLDTVGVGLDGSAFILDLSSLDGNSVLDGIRFTTTATATATLGSLTGSATATVIPVVNATGSAALGSITATAVGIVSDTGEADAPLGGLTASGDAVVSIVAEASAGLGEATSAATGVITVVASAEGLLGGLVASADGAVSADAVGDAPLGGLAASATGTVTPQPTPPQPQQFVGGQPYRQRKPRPKKVEPVVEFVPEIVVPNPKTVMAYCTPIVAGVTASAVGDITFVAEDDDLQVLLML